MEDYVNVFWEYPISEHGVFPLDDSTMIRWRLRIPPPHAVLPCDDYDSFNFSQQLMAAAFVVENNLLCKNKGLRGLAVCNSKYATQNSSSVYTNVKADANNGSSCPSCQAWPLVVCGEGRSRWYEEFYWVYSICISLSTHIDPSTGIPLPGMVQSLASDRRCFHAPPASYTPIWLGCRQECQVEVRKGGDTDGPASFKPTAGPYQAFLTPC